MFDAEHIIKNEFENAIRNLTGLLNSDYIKRLSEISMEIAETLKHGNKVLIAGNGGSAADAQHFAAELVGRFVAERRGLPAVALTTDTSIITSIANDYRYDKIFSRQIEALATEGDIFIGISTSGNSTNVIEAVKEAKMHGVRTIGFLGKDGGKLLDICDLALLVPSDTTARVQEAQELSYHLICQIVDSVIRNEKEFPGRQI